MTDLPHIVVGGRPPTGEHIRVFEVWNREHGQPTVWSVANINLAVDWWNALPGNVPAGPRERLIAAIEAVPHVKLGDKVTAELRDIFQAYCREHAPLPAPATVMTATNVNKAIDWWNGLGGEAEAEELAEAVAQAWHYPDTGEDET